MITVAMQRPTQAHLSVPEGTPTQIVSTHIGSMTGLKNALRRCYKTHGDYSKSHGNAAAMRIWLILDNGTRVPYSQLGGWLEILEIWKQEDYLYACQQLSRRAKEANF